MAQHANPHWYTHREYLRLMLSSDDKGFGILPASTSPILSLLLLVRVPYVGGLFCLPVVCRMLVVCFAIVLLVGDEDAWV